MQPGKLEKLIDTFPPDSESQMEEILEIQRELLALVKADKSEKSAVLQRGRKRIHAFAKNCPRVKVVRLQNPFKWFKEYFLFRWLLRFASDKR